MYLRIIRPLPGNLEEFDLARFVLHGGYEVNAPLCDLLILGGYAIPTDPPAPSREAAIKAIAGAVVGSIAKPTDHLERPVRQEPPAPKARPRRR
jgi:hypothetical protein